MIQGDDGNIVSVAIPAFGLVASASSTSEDGDTSEIQLNFGAAIATSIGPLVSDESGFPTTGSQHDMRFSRGALTDILVSMQVSNGDPSTFDVFVVNGDESITSSTISWTDDMRFGIDRVLDSVEVLVGFGEQLIE